MVKPYNYDISKKNEIRAMFNGIARNYDFLNHLLSFGIDVRWRKQLIKKVIEKRPSIVLDVATGTADLAIMSVAANPLQVYGVDLSKEMLEIGRKKVLDRNFQDIISLLECDAEDLPFDSFLFDFAMVAFGVRNFEDLNKGISEIFRVLKPNSTFAVLEFSQPTIFPVKQLYRFYSYRLLPAIGYLFSKDKSAYSYLPKSISEFPSGVDFIHILENQGFVKCQFRQLSFGIATLYWAEKPGEAIKV